MLGQKSFTESQASVLSPKKAIRPNPLQQSCEQIKELDDSESIDPFDDSQIRPLQKYDSGGDPGTTKNIAVERLAS